ncbi:TPA: hypothetical protein DCQ22_04180 [Candidatus Nomurabacteria bacterium]|nr:hypothetical protein [Candidatus Nomurabacteria bacterium]
MEENSTNGKGFKFNFCPECGSHRLVYDHLRLDKGRHRFCRHCGKRWIVIYDTFNDFNDEVQKTNKCGLYLSTKGSFNSNPFPVPEKG